MKTLVITTSLLAALTTASYAQERAMGLDFNESTFGSVPAYPRQGEKSLGNLPITADLSIYSPPVADQGNVPSCVAWSTAYGAYTVQFAAQKGIHDKGQLQAVALSAMLPFKQLRPNCERGLDLPEIADLIIANGNITYPEFSGAACGTTVPGSLIQQARQNHPIKAFLRLFEGNATNAEKIFLTKEQIGINKTPVIVGIKTTDAFMRLTTGDDYYRPAGNYRGLHAVTVVGYDATSFKILNSWGTSWGKNGYFSVRFQDFADITIGGLTLVLPDGYTPGPRTNSSTQLGGSFAFQQLDTDGQFKRVTPTHIGNGVYELAKKDWQLGQMFQLLTNNRKQGQFMYVFSVDAANKVEVHWPLNKQFAAYNDELIGLTTTPISPKANFEWVVPAPDKALTITKAGTDYLCVLFCDKALDPERDDFLARIRNASGDIYSRIRTALGSRLVPAANIRYDQNQMGASTTTTQGDIVPLILKVQSVN